MARFFEMTNLPIPPPSNNQYFPYVGKGAKFPRFVPTTALKDFHKACDAWFKENVLSVGKSRQQCAEWLLKGYEVEIEVYFFFPYSMIYTLNDDVRKMDISNRIKAVEDHISKMICIDDSRFFKFGGIKWESTRTEPWAHALISPWRPGGFGEFKDYLEKKKAFIIAMQETT